MVELTARANSGQNEVMFRVIIAIGVVVLFWATGPSSGPPAVDAGHALSGVAGGAVAGESDHGESDQQWRIAQHAIAVVTESVWKSSPVHAGLGAARVTRLSEIARFVSSPDPPAASTPHYLLHTPLLI